MGAGARRWKTGRMKFLTVLLLAIVLAGCGEEPLRTSRAGGDPGTRPAPTATPVGTSFRTPSGRFACATLDGTLVCDVRPQPGDEGFPKPNVPMDAICEREASGEWGNGVSLATSGSAKPNCSTGVNVVDESPPVLAYGASWARDGFTCRSARAGLTCRRGDHGFFVNRDVIDVH